MSDKRGQVVAQCRAVAHMATALAEICRDFAVLFEGGHTDNLIDQVGRRTASQMEVLGDMLNGMDAATQEDELMAPIFKEAQRLWPATNKP